MIPSHEIEEKWTVDGDWERWHGQFFHGNSKIGHISGERKEDFLCFHTCHFKCYAGERVGEEIAARAILFGYEFQQSLGNKVSAAYKYYTLTADEARQADYETDDNPAPTEDCRMDPLFRRLGFKDVPVGYGPEKGAGHLGQLIADLSTIMPYIKRAWGYLFYQRRAESLQMDWQEEQANIDWGMAEKQWYANYVKAREQINFSDKNLDRIVEMMISQQMPVNLKASFHEVPQYTPK